MDKTGGSVIVSWNFNSPDTGVLIVGKPNGKTFDIINAFQGEEAKELYERLTIKKQ